jgi:phage replication initiation protein
MNSHLDHLPALRTESTPAAGVLPARAASTDGDAPAAAAVPFSKTGQKITDDRPLISGETASAHAANLRGPQGFELDAEWVELFTNGRRIIPLKTPIPYTSGISNAALIDWLSFTVRPPEAETHEWVIRQLQRLGVLGTVEELNGGYAGYAHKAQYQDNKTRLCLIAWGGKNQAATVYVSFPGHGCARIEKWQEIRAWLEQHKATITRLDLAYDDYQAERVSIHQAVEWYWAGGFSAGGRLPSHKLHGDWLLGDESRTGRTLEIGSREGGKLCRIYEKGKQLGDPENPWVRVEVEWHNESRHIPYEALTNPGKYLAGAYECLHFLDREQSRIQTQQRAAKVSFDKAMTNGRHLAGKLVNLALEVYQGDYAEVVEQLRREGYPARVEPYMHSVGDEPEILADDDLVVWEGMPEGTPHLTRGER